MKEPVQPAHTPEDIILQKHRKSALINLCKSRRNKIDQLAADNLALKARIKELEELASDRLGRILNNEP